VATRIEIAQLKESMPDSTMIYVTHDQIEAMTLASRIVVLAGGGISQYGSPLELYERPRNTFVAQFIGSPAMNMLPGKIVETGEITTISLPSGKQMSVPIPSNGNLRGADVAVGVRPEDLTITEDSADAMVTTNVLISEKLGDVTVVYGDPVSAFEGDEDQTIAKLPGIHHIDKGAPMALTAAPEKVHLFHKGESLRYI